uniref:DUF1758 domain-containing protein n=1 Tax=Loa loa TaxID=7209 RepID=A0A1I7VN70_LOALO
MERLKKLGLYELCLKNDHSQETCVGRIKRFYYESGYNSALYRKRNEMKQSKNFKNSEEANINPKIVAATTSDNSIRETYMMCKEVRLVNSDGPRRTSKALIFFDTGSDCNYVTESIVSKLSLKQTSPSLGMLITGIVGTRKYESRKITFGVQTLSGNVKNIQPYIVDSILERIPYVTNNKRNKLVEGKWGKPDVLGVEEIADLVIRNSIKRPPDG